MEKRELPPPVELTAEMLTTIKNTPKSRQNLKQPAAGENPNAATPPSVEMLIMQLIKLAYTDIVEWLKAWCKNTTTHSSVSDFWSTRDHGLIFRFHFADDEADLVFNDEAIAWKGLGEDATWHYSESTVNGDQINILTIGVNNRGRLVWEVAVDVYDGKSRNHIKRIHFNGNDGIFDNFHVVSARIRGK